MYLVRHISDYSKVSTAERVLSASQFCSESPISALAGPKGEPWRFILAGLCSYSCRWRYVHTLVYI